MTSINGFGQATSEMIKKFEKHIGFFLPDDYKQFLQECNGGTPKVKYSSFYVEDLGQEIPLDILYGLEVKKGLDLYGWYNDYKSDLLPFTIIIGRDPGGGMLVLINDPEEEDNGVYYYDHSYQFEQSDDEGNIYFVADSFREFINELKDPE